MSNIVAWLIKKNQMSLIYLMLGGVNKVTIINKGVWKYEHDWLNMS